MTESLYDTVPAYGLNKTGTRYQYPAPPGFTANRWGFLRVTRVADAISDQETLARWRERIILCGLAADRGLIFDELTVGDMDSRDFLNDKAEEAFIRGGGNVGARKGTARHTALEGRLVDGAALGHGWIQDQLDALLAVLDEKEMEIIPGSMERKVFHQFGAGVMGTRDAHVLHRPTGQVGVLDLKTSKKIYGYLEYCIQEWLYDSAIFEWHGPDDDRGGWQLTEPLTLTGHPAGKFPGERVALIAHMPEEGPPEVHEVDLSVGAGAARTALDVLQWRSRIKSCGGLRP